MGESRGESGAEQDADALGPLTPLAIWRRADDRLCVVAVNPDGVISIAPLRLIPDPPRKRLIECAHCRRWLILNEFADGTLTATPLSQPPPDEGD